MPRKRVFDPEQLVTAIQSCSISIPTDRKDAEGNTVFEDYTFNSESKPVRADHPAVISNPDLFRAVDGQPSAA